MITLAQDAAEVRRLLNGPKQQKPSFDDIVSALIASIQHMNNRATGTGKPWTDNTITVSTEADTADYGITHTEGPTFGKALFVYRDIGDNVYIPVPFVDYVSEIHDQRYQFFVHPPDAGEIPHVSGEKIAFYRRDGSPRMRVYPIPEEVRTYSIVYASGALDWTTFEWTDVPAFPEFSHFRQLMAALKVLARAEWEGYDFNQNSTYRAELRRDLTAEYAIQNSEFTPFIRNTQIGPSTGEVGYYWE